MSREWMKDEHLRETVEGISIKPLRRDSIMVDIAHSNYYPSLKGQHGSYPLDIGAISVRGFGHLAPDGDGWKVTKHFSLSGMGGNVTPTRERKAYAAIERIVSDWAATNADALAEAEHIWRNNDASRLEDSIAEHENALGILRANLDACDNGRDYNVYPDIPTKR